IVHRGFRGPTVNGLPFSALADSTAGGRQIDGFHGISIEYMRSKKFLQADGGWKRIVWMPEAIKERIKDFIPKDIVDKIATEKDASTVEELRIFLEKGGHPIVERWKEKEKEAEVRPRLAEPVVTEDKVEAPEALLKGTITTVAAPGTFRIVLKNARIRAEKITIKSWD
ncbi:acetyl-CoA decarbonylase/synthase complex subunit beta, partial [Candidatus Bathyarchaeota archaeon]|nr:acetyl-CoA decarbonylase/synthase complex subunit beta [Candidatus Bathyarchaeota archaeon]